MPGYSKNADPSLSGQFDINVERLTANIAQDLPIVIFGVASLQAGYQSILTLPSGVTLEVEAGLNNTTDYSYVDFIFTDGSANEDIVRVSSTTLQYPELLAATQTDLLEYYNIKMTLTDFATNQSQFNRSILFADNNIFGDKKQKNLNPSSYKKSSQFQDNQIDLPVKGSIDKETSLIFSLIQSNVEVNLSFFFDNYMRYNASILKRR